MTIRTIDCAECVMAGTSACDDCVVTFIVNRELGDAVIVDADEERALRALGDGGLVPQLRHRPRETTAKRPEGSRAWSRPIDIGRAG